LLHIQVDVQGSEPTADAIFESKGCRFAILSGWENRTIAHVRRNVELQALRAKKKGNPHRTSVSPCQHRNSSPRLLSHSTDGYVRLDYQ
jgi:hypothetical protein